MALAVALLMGFITLTVLIFFIVSAITLFFTYWYITFPAVALIIIYKKRNSIRKLKFRKRGPKLHTHGVMPSSELNKRIEWVRQQNAEDERRRKEFCEKSLRHMKRSLRG